MRVQRDIGHIDKDLILKINIKEDFLKESKEKNIKHVDKDLMLQQVKIKEGL